MELRNQPIRWAGLVAPRAGEKVCTNSARDASPRRSLRPERVQTLHAREPGGPGSSRIDETGRSEKAKSHKSEMDATGESNINIVPKIPPNKALQSAQEAE